MAFASVENLRDADIAPLNRRQPAVSHSTTLEDDEALCEAHLGGSLLQQLVAPQPGKLRTDLFDIAVVDTFQRQ